MTKPKKRHPSPKVKKVDLKPVKARPEPKAEEIKPEEGEIMRTHSEGYYDPTVLIAQPTLTPAPPISPPAVGGFYGTKVR